MDPCRARLGRGTGGRHGSRGWRSACCWSSGCSWARRARRRRWSARCRTSATRGPTRFLSTLALMALLAEAFVGYLLVVLALRSLATLPGLRGRLARRITFALVPAAVRRLVDLLVGGALLIQVTVAAPDPWPGRLSSGSCQAVVAPSVWSRSGGPVTLGDPAPIRLGTARLRLPVDEKEPVEARPYPPPVSGATAALAGGWAVQGSTAAALAERRAVPGGTGGPRPDE